MRRLRTSLVVTAALLLPAAAAYAWNGTGHMVVAAIAYRDLDATTRQAGAVMVRQHPQ